MCSGARYHTHAIQWSKGHIESVKDFFHFPLKWGFLVNRNHIFEVHFLVAYLSLVRWSGFPHFMMKLDESSQGKPLRPLNCKYEVLVVHQVHYQIIKSQEVECKGMLSH